jgi:2-oxo-4-hydroxy-4-carboxy-5-ureidoimidazoline decarboxylase
VTLDAINHMDCGTFVATLGWVFEHSPWVAERAWSRGPFASVEALHETMVEVVAGAEPEEQTALIREHPDLGTRAQMSSASRGEQAGAGLDQLTLEEYQELYRLNSAYREKFGFPFIFAVKGSTKHDILRALEQRLASDPIAEHALALTQIYRIALIRLEETLHA